MASDVGAQKGWYEGPSTPRVVCNVQTTFYTGDRELSLLLGTRSEWHLEVGHKSSIAGSSESDFRTYLPRNGGTEPASNRHQ